MINYRTTLPVFTTIDDVVVSLAQWPDVSVRLSPENPWPSFKGHHVDLIGPADQLVKAVEEVWGMRGDDALHEDDMVEVEQANAYLVRSTVPVDHPVRLDPNEPITLVTPGPDRRLVPAHWSRAGLAQAEGRCTVCGGWALALRRDGEWFHADLMVDFNEYAHVVTKTA